MKRPHIQRRPLADTTLAGLRQESKVPSPFEQRSAKAAIDAAKTRTFRVAADAWLKAKEKKGLVPSTLNKIRS